MHVHFVQIARVHADPESHMYLVAFEESRDYMPAFMEVPSFSGRGGATMGARDAGGRRRPGSVREGGIPPAQLGGMGERCKLPYRGLRRSPRSQRFLRSKTPKTTQKRQGLLRLK